MIKKILYRTFYKKRSLNLDARFWIQKILLKKQSRSRLRRDLIELITKQQDPEACFLELKLLINDRVS